MFPILLTGKDLVPKPSRESETRARGRGGEVQNGAVFSASPPFVRASGGATAVLPPPPDWRAPHAPHGPPPVAPRHGPTTCGELAFANWTVVKDTFRKNKFVKKVWEYLLIKRYILKRFFKCWPQIEKAYDYVILVYFLTKINLVFLLTVFINDRCSMHAICSTYKCKLFVNIKQ